MKRILILLVVITGLYIVFNQTDRYKIFSSGSNNTKNGQATVSSDIKMIKINIASTSTTIIAEDRQNVKADYRGKQKLVVSENGDTVEVSVQSKWFNWPSFSEKSKLKIYVPKNFDRNMIIDLGSGNLNFFGQSKEKPMKLDELSVDIGSGNMNLQNLEVQHFKHNSASGNVRIDSLKTETGKVNVNSGNLTIKHYTGAMEAVVSSGKLNLQLDKLIDSINMKVSSGHAGLDLPDHADFTLDGEVSSGNITCDYPLTTKDLNKKSIHGTHGTGKYKINLKVSSGNIIIH